MARIYRLQLTPNLIERLKGDESFPTEILCFDTDKEKADFAGDPERFLRSIGLYTDEMQFNGVTMPDDLPLSQLQIDPSVPLRCFHNKYCQMVCDA